MTREDTKEILKRIVAAYPHFNPEDKSATIDMWHSMLRNESFEEVLLRFDAYVKTNRYAPSISDLLSQKAAIKKNEFTNFEQREYGSSFFNQLEKAIAKS